MGMFIDSARRSQHDAGKAEKAATRLGRELTTGRKVATPQDDPSTWMVAQRAQATAGLLDTIHTGLSEVATNIRVADATMQAVGEQLGTMHGTLTEARKFPAGDPARQRYIADFNGFGQQIDDTVWTLSQSGARELLTNPAGD